MKKRVFSLMLSIITIISTIVIPTSASSKGEAYQGIFMKDGIFVRIVLSTSGVPGDPIGTMYHTTKPVLNEDGYPVSFYDYTDLGDIYIEDNKYIVKNNNVFYGELEFTSRGINLYQVSYIVSHGDRFEGSYVQVSNVGANMSYDELWIDIPERTEKNMINAYINVLEKYLWHRTDYTLQDIDNNGIYELIIRGETGYSVYTYKADEAVYMYSLDHGDYFKDSIFFCVDDYSLLYELGKQIKVILNNEEVSFDQPPIIQNDRTLVPLRAIFEAMGATVYWNGNTQTVISTLYGTTVQLTIGSNILYRNGEAKTLDVPAQIINDYTMVPARAVAEAFGAYVDWDGSERTVYIHI